MQRICRHEFLEMSSDTAEFKSELQEFKQRIVPNFAEDEVTVHLRGKFTISNVTLFSEAMSESKNVTTLILQSTEDMEKTSCDVLLARIISQNQIKVLKICNDNLSNSFYQELANILKTAGASVLEKITMTNNIWVKNTVFTVLMQAIVKNNTLQEFHAEKMNLSWKGVEALRDVLKFNTTLKRLILPRLYYEGAQSDSFGSFIQTAKVNRTTELKSCKAAAEMICDGLKANRSLESIDLTIFIFSSDDTNYEIYSQFLASVTSTNITCIKMHYPFVDGDKNLILEDQARQVEAINKQKIKSARMAALFSCGKFAESPVFKFKHDPLFDKNLAGLLSEFMDAKAEKTKVLEVDGIDESMMMEVTAFSAGPGPGN